MRSALFLILLSAPLWATGNTCTLKKSFNCSGGTCSASQIVADSGNAYFTGSGCTAAGYTIASDFLIIPDTVTFTDNVGWTYANSGKGAESYISSITAGGTIPVGSGTCTITISGGTVINSNGTPTAGGCTYSGSAISVRGNSCAASCSLDFPMPWYTAASAVPTATITCSPTACLTATVTVNWHQGSGVSAIFTSNTGAMVCASTMTVKGSIGYTADFSNTTPYLFFSPNCAMTMNSSGATSLADGTKPIYAIGPNEASQFAKRTVSTTGSCTVSTCSITSNPTGKSGITQYGNDDGGVVGKGIAFSNLGSPSFAFIETLALNALTNDVENSSITNCGVISDQFGPSSSSFLKNTWSGTVKAQGQLATIFVLYPLGTSTTETFKGNVFDIQPFQTINSSTFDLEDNYIVYNLGSGLLGGSVTWSTFTHNLNFWPVEPTGQSINGNMLENYEVVDSPAMVNPHINLWNFNIASAFSLSGIVESTDSLNGDSGEYVASISDPGSNTPTYTVNNVLMLPDALGFSWAELFSFTEPHFIQQFLHNYWYGVYATGVSGNGQFGMVDLEEGRAANVGAVPAYAYSILFNPGTTAAGVHGGYMALNLAGTPTQNVVTPASANHNDNYLGEPTLTSCAGCTNQGKGYAAKFSVTPGVNDISTSPNLAAWQRSVVLFDQDYLAISPCTTFSSGTTYAVGDCASIAVAGTYWGRTVNYRCIQLGCQSHQPGTFPTASSGSWKEWWEWNALFAIRSRLGVNYTNYVDGALALGGHCVTSSPCSVVQALYEWVSQGTVTQNPSNWGIDSGVDVGPVARSIVQHIMPMVVTP